MTAPAYLLKWPTSDQLPATFFTPTWLLPEGDPTRPWEEILDVLFWKVHQIEHATLAARLDHVVAFLGVGAALKQDIGRHTFHFVPVACDHAIDLCDAFLRDKPLPAESSIVTEVLERLGKAMQPAKRAARDFQH
ncbi:hypothetical protein [Amycolatopsis aidingensis]|uniref:hypothetical protein n=1 Tax=Amycolatopsis aidingensis TaxID=2842453 RepID=UPI001C0D43B1|nr:hypothetical protein [Amycolatopsis aidingensis]